MLTKAAVTTILPVVDMNRARDFYERKLGLDPRGFAADGNFVFQCGGDATSALIPKPQGTKAEHTAVSFEVGDVVNLPYADGAFDCVIASDLFEHLAIEDMERALDAAARLARRAVCLSFFNTADIADHFVRPKSAYYNNTLSRSRVVEQLHRRFPSVTATPIATWLAERYDYRHTYNPKAWTLVAERPPD